MPDDPLSDFEHTAFAHEGKERVVYRRGDGPAVVIMTEMPGITPAVADFARRVAGRGCTVWLPDLFGVAGQAPSPLRYVRSIVPACISREFTAFASGRTTPVVDWLRALARHAHSECGGPGVGAVGMCWTGGFALGMLVDEELLAPVLSQPSLPLVPPWRRGNASDLGVDEADLARVRQRVADGACVLGLRFTDDKLSPPQRFEALRRELGDGFIGVEIDSSPDNVHGIRRRAHSVLTEDLVDEPGHPTHEALEQVLEFLSERLHPA